MLNHLHLLTFLIQFLSPVSQGANALKFEDEIVQEQQQETSNVNVTNEEAMHND